MTETGPDLRRHHVVADRGQEALGGDVHVFDGAVLQDQAELVAGEAAEHVAAAQPRADAFGDVRDHGVRHVEAEGVVDPRQMIDADQHEGAGGAETLRLLDRLRQGRDQVGTVELAGQGIMPRQLDELLVASVALIVDANDALHTRRLAVGAGEPAAGLLDPQQRRRGRGAHAIFDAIRHTAVAMGRRRMHQRFAANGALRFDQPGKLRPACQRLRRDIGEDSAGVVAPGHRVGREIPDKGGLAETGQDGRGLRQDGCCHVRLVSGQGK